MKKNKLLLLFVGFLIFIAVFVLQKITFMLYYHDIYADFKLIDYAKVLFYGLQHDASIAGYFSIIPGFIIIASYWLNTKLIRRISIVYYAFISFLIATVFVVDLILYKYWGFRLDSTPLFYMKSPANALASSSWLVNLGGLAAIFFISYLLYILFSTLLIVTKKADIAAKFKVRASFVVLFEIVLLFLPIRGGIKESTMNVGKVYFSNNILLNHAAVNPIFSLFESLMLEQKFDRQYRFMSNEKAAEIFTSLTDAGENDSKPSLFNIKKPNVVVMVLESFMSLDISELGGMNGVAVRLDSLCKEGVLFTNFYANSFRTDRGLVSVLSGFPAQPNTSIMKFPRKTQKLPSFPMSLKNAGYQLQYLYGGDVDFTSMRSYLKVCGFDNIVEDVSFKANESTTKWGVPDHLVFKRLYSEIEKQQKKPFLKIIQTLSSHDPFDVPYPVKIKDPYLNSVSYTDSCLGDFIDKLKKLEVWKNTIVIMVPDHAMRYPYGIDNRSVNRYKIPLIIVGGALKSPSKIDTYASQIDIAATLLSQLGIDHSDFRYSKNILNSQSPHFGFFTFQNGFGMVTPDNEYVYDYEAKKEFVNNGIKDKNKAKAEAMIQSLYNDIASK